MSCSLSGNRLSALVRRPRLIALALTFAAFAAPAAAQNAPGVDVGGYVAPRCWSVPTPGAEAALTVRCNTVNPQLSLRARAAMSTSAIPAAASRTDRGVATLRPASVSVSGPLEVVVALNL